MKCVMHKQSQEYRVQSRGSRFFVQRHDGSKGNRERDPWYDVGTPKYTQTEAIAAMYNMCPMVNK